MNARKDAVRGALLFLAVSTLLFFSFSAILSLGSARTDEERKAAAAETAALAPVRTLSKVVATGVWVVVQVAVCLSVVYLVLAFSLSLGSWMRVRSRLVHQRGGVFPLVESRGEWYDPNRNAGDNPYISMAALRVQEAAALGGVSRGSARVASGVTPAVVEQGEEYEVGRLDDLPNEVRIDRVLSGSPSLHQLPLGLESTPSGLQVRHESLFNLSHVGVGGSSGYGKSVFLRWLTWLLVSCRERVGLVLVDVEATTLLPFSSSDRLLYPLAAEPEDIRAVLGELASGELERRRSLFSGVGALSLSQYNGVSRETALEPVVCVVDETAMLGGDKEAVGFLQLLALRGRKYGIYLVCASQDWKATLFDTRFTNQLSSRFQFGCRNGAQSRTLMGESGAEEFTTPGRCLAQLKGSRTTVLQTPLLPDLAIRGLPAGGPQREMPALPSPSWVDQDDLNLPERDRVLLLHRRGLPSSKIEELVFGHTGGNAWRKVNAILRSQEP